MAFYIVTMTHPDGPEWDPMPVTAEWFGWVGI